MALEATTYPNGGTKMADVLTVKDRDILHVMDVRIGAKRQQIGTAPDGGRHEMGGPIDPVPFAFVGPMCSVIDNHGGSAASDRREGFTEVKTGQLIEVEGIPGTWILLPPERYSGDWCKLRRVGPKPEGALV